MSKKELKDLHHARAANSARAQRIESVPKWLPDWRKYESYAHLKRKNVASQQWAWEFLRRNTDYQRFFESVVHVPGPTGSKAPHTSWGGAWDPPHEPGETFGEYIERIATTGPQPEPRARVHEGGRIEVRGNVWNWAADFGITPYQIRDPADDRPPKFGMDGGMLAGLSNGPNVYEVEVRPHELFVRLDLRQPLHLQLPAVRRVFGVIADAGQRRGAFKISTVRARRKFLEYLRLLDAAAFGCDAKEIAAELHEARYNAPTVTANQRRTLEKQVSRDLSEAKKLRDFGYRDVALTSAVADKK